MSAEAQTFNFNSINYNIIDLLNFKVEIGSNQGYVGVANIPATVSFNNQAYQVTQIGSSAFQYCSGLTSVTIPNSITTIWGYAFQYCSSLTSVTIPDSVTTIGYAAFSYCSSLTSVTLPNYITSIEDFIFRNCSSLTTVTIPNSVIYIQNSAFSNCSALNSVIIPNSVTTIRSSAFVNCSSLTSITIPNSIISIESYAFYDCSSLTTVNCDIINPLTINANVFGNVNQNTCALNVNPASATAYQTAPVWQNFNPINGVLINNSFVKNSFYIYPNPTNDIVNITLENNSELEKVTIYNQLGKVLKTSSNNIIPVSELASGTYLVEVVTNKGKATKTLLIK